MKRSKPNRQLDEPFYDGQIERMSSLAKFPHLPAGKQEIRRALRRISETDGDFITHLISDVVDTATACPTPAELIQRAGAKRHSAHASVGNADCELCHGSGFVTIVRKVALPGLAPYESEFAAACTCRGGK